ncbi:MAG: hypothetical protein C0614_03915 [Desulfuromonas sp.]|nr:MAG: hypothetical protein C0614_03915 [Desulfuromonas sp.]
MRLLLLTCWWLLLVIVPVYAEQVTDALGRQVGGDLVPQRVVSLAPAVTEILFALGLDDEIVGVTSFCNYPERARSKPKIGEYASPNLEILAAMQPELVVMAADASSPELLSRLEGLGIAVYIAYPRSVAETVTLIRSLGQLLGKAEAAAVLATGLEQTAACAQRQVALRPKVRVLCTVMSQPLVVAGRQTLIDDLIRIAGGDNVVPEGLSRYPTWGIESVLSADPDLILVSPHPGQTDPSAFYRNWPELKAVRTGRLASVEADWIQRPGPRLSLGLRALTRALHGIDVDPESSQCQD